MLFINRADSLKELKNVYLWGTGQLATRIMKQFKEEISEMNICGFIDNDIKKEGKDFFGYKIFLPQVLKENILCHVIILSDYYKEIVDQIEKHYLANVGRCESCDYFIKYRILERYQNSEDAEIQEIVKWINDESLSVFNYPFTRKYNNTKYDIVYDSEKDMYYTFLYDKKMYIPNIFRNKQSVELYIRQIMMEQDKLSPHCYMTDEFTVNEGDVVVDAGVAEGNFALSVIDKVKKIYLVEPDIEWVKALKYTFEPYAEKVIIVNKYLSNYDSKETVMIDSFIDDKLDFIKMDIEGEEYYALQGAASAIVRNKNIKCAVCTYHQEFDHMNISDLLKKMGFQIQTSAGYMWFPSDKDYFYSLPTLRRGVVRAEKSENEK